MYESEDTFSRAFITCFLEEFQNESAGHAVKELKLLSEEKNRPFYLLNLFQCLTAICAQADKPVVLMIDEIDSAKNNQVFLDFLSQLRKYYLQRERKGTAANWKTIRPWSG